MLSRSLRPAPVLVAALLSIVPVALAAPPAKTAPASPTATPPPPGVVLFNRALAATRAGKVAEAERLYRILLQAEPKAAAAWANLGLLQASRGDNAGAMDSLRRATSLSPQTAAFQAQLSAALFQANRFAEAETAARRALVLDPKNDMAAFNLGTLLLRRGRAAEAVGPLRAVHARQPGNVRAGVSLAYALAAANRAPEGIALASKLAARSPNDADIALLLGDMAARAGQNETARKAYTRAAELRPKDVRPRLNAALLAERLGRRDEALRGYEAVLALQPDTLPARFNRGRLIYSDDRLPPARRYAEAEREFRAAMQLAPKDPNILTNLAFSVMNQGRARWEEAGRIFAAALVVGPSYTPAHVGAGYLAEQQERMTDALAQYRAVLAYDPTSFLARRRLAGVLYATNKKDEAYREFEEIARRNPTDTRTLAELASLQVADKRLPEALATYDKIIARDPKSAGAFVGAGQVLEQQNRPDEARRRYEAALRADPKQAAAYVGLASLLERQNKRAEALTVYERWADADRDSPQAQWLLAQEYADRGRDEDALKQMRRVRPQPDDPMRLTYLTGPAQLFAKRKRWAEAAAEYQRLAAAEPTQTVLQYALAGALEAAGRGAEAEPILRNLAASAPGDPQPRIQLAQLTENGKRLDESAALWEEALRLNPEQTVAIAGLRRVRAAQNRPEAVPAFLETLALGDPAQPNFAAVRAMRALYAGEPGNYVTFLGRVAAKYPKNREALGTYAAALLADHQNEAAAQTYRRMIALPGGAADADAHVGLGAVLEAQGKKDEAAAEYGAAARAGNPEARAALKRMGVEAPTPPAAGAGKDH